MNHLKPDEWLSYLDGEPSPEAAQRVGEHLKQCAQCAAELEGWRRSVQKLERLSFPARSALSAPRSAGFRAATAVKWGLAAGFVLLVGMALGRLTAPDAGTMKEAVAAQVRTELRGEMRADLLAAFGPEPGAMQGFPKQLRQAVQQQRDLDQRRLVALISEVRSAQVADCLALRQDLETAVEEADSDLRQNSQTINRLADTLLTARK
jgi:anti-sigma factor RsiW